MQIKTEKQPTRCEVCHKTDFFNPIENHCQRCSGVSIMVKPPSLPVAKVPTFLKARIVAVFTIFAFSFLIGLAALMFSFDLFLKKDWFLLLVALLFTCKCFAISMNAFYSIPKKSSGVLITKKES